MNNFPEKLIKGKIVELIFELMVRDAEKFTVLRSGYEYTHPELAQYQQSFTGKGKEALRFFEHTPDFIIFSKEENELFLVEVKYQRSLDMNRLKEIAEDSLKRWRYIWLFVATQDGFFFSPCSEVAKGKPPYPLTEGWAPKEKQKEYLSLLHKFIQA